jgi:SAM-dependent methyltransferase
VTEPSFLRTTRAGYDAIAAGYAERFTAELEVKPLGRAMLTAFAELVRGAGGGPVADVGSGPGRVTAFLRELGLGVFGVDLSPAMVELARKEYPDLQFEEGTMTALDLADNGLSGIVAWYSVIHIPPTRLPAVFAEFHRVLAPGGQLLLAFQMGDEPLHLSQAFGQEISLDFHRLMPDRVGKLLRKAGFAVDARMIREPHDGEKVPQVHVLAHKA